MPTTNTDAPATELELEALGCVELAWGGEYFARILTAVGAIPTREAVEDLLCAVERDLFDHLCEYANEMFCDLAADHAAALAAEEDNGS